MDYQNVSYTDEDCQKLFYTIKGCQKNIFRQRHPRQGDQGCNIFDPGAA